MAVSGLAFITSFKLETLITNGNHIWLQTIKISLIGLLISIFEMFGK